MMNDYQWDKLLKIKTTGRDDSRSDQYHYPYEPTSYSVLERLAKSDYINKKNTVVFYYLNEEYVSYLMTEDALMFSDEIDCRDLFEGDNEREDIDF